MAEKFVAKTFKNLPAGSLYAFQVTSEKHVALAHRFVELQSAKKRHALVNPATSNFDIHAVACWAVEKSAAGPVSGSVG